MFRDGFTPRAMRVSHGSWLRFVKAMGDLLPVEAAALDQASEFLGELESTRMVKSFKMLTLLALLDEDQLPGSVSIEVLEKSFRRRAERSAKLRMDVGPALADPGKLTRMLEVNPINAWTGDGNSNRKTFFTYRDRNFASKMTLAAELRNAFKELVRELADWRLAEYLDRGGDEETLPASGDQNEVAATSGPALWQTYLREKIPPQFELTFSVAIWNAGFVASDRHLFLLVTLEKDDLPDDHGYEDKFLSADCFQWKSQNSTTQQSKRGQLLRHHVAKGLKVHLFVRRSKKIRNQSAPFYYCGEVTFESWHDERPITINWRLSTPVPERLHALFQIGR
jgi:hypothetical protein